MYTTNPEGVESSYPRVITRGEMSEARKVKIRKCTTNPEGVE